MGYVGPMMIPFQMLGAPTAALVHDRTDSYDVACFAFAAACAVALGLLLRVRSGPAASA